MSKQSDAKIKQGFRIKPNTCSNCTHFTLIKTEEKRKYGYGNVTIESNLRCSIGEFKVNKTNTCNFHLLKRIL